MHIIKLSAIDSTNSYLRNMVSGGEIEDMTTVVTLKQTKGKGQMGSSWTSDEGKNLTASVFKHNVELSIEQAFLISQIVSVSIIDSLRMLGVRNLKIKWPNDILADKKKIGGILIENIIKTQQLQSSIIGMGINVNQENFPGLPQASSMKSLTGKHFDLDAVLITILKEIEQNFTDTDTEYIRSLYIKYLFRLNKPSTFLNSDENNFTGYIRGVTDQGKLIVEIEDGILREFDLKEVKMLY
ncbi:MAG: biotin--[acetyl-CoA-carboxylase] ligase [Flavobacteriaceae bacterium]|nr:biotin--[acetyl-CoA-carboxylase] ligase [Flavobacteriaceae bacterium]